MPSPQTLLLTRGGTPRVRLAALRTVVALFTALGTEGLALLPSALPYLSELMEDNDGGVVAAAHRAVRKVCVVCRRLLVL